MSRIHILDVQPRTVTKKGETTTTPGWSEAHGRADAALKAATAARLKGHDSILTECTLNDELDTRDLRAALFNRDPKAFPGKVVKKDTKGLKNPQAA